jgi:hypothetical protein
MPYPNTKRRRMFLAYRKERPIRLNLFKELDLVTNVDDIVSMLEEINVADFSHIAMLILDCLVEEEPKVFARKKYQPYLR